MEVNNPTTEEVIKEFWKCNELRSRWTNEINHADRWAQYNIDRWGKFLPFIKWKRAYIRVTDLNGKVIG